MNQITYNTIIKGLKVGGHQVNVIAVFEEMKQKGLDPDLISYNSIIDYCFKHQDYQNGQKYLQEMQKNGV